MQYATHGKKVVFEGDVRDATNWIQKNVGEHDTVNLKEYFEDQVYGVHKVGEENYRYYYQCLGNGRYSIFIIQWIKYIISLAFL